MDMTSPPPLPTGRQAYPILLRRRDGCGVKIYIAFVLVKVKNKMSRQMKSRFMPSLLIGVLLLSACSTSKFCRHEFIERLPLANSRQVLVVITDSWDSTRGEAQRFEREKLGDPWTPAGEKAIVNVGRDGLGWGAGLHGFSRKSRPVKKEGDGKAPAGVFKIATVFGYAAADSVPFLKFPYLPIDDSTECIDDIKSEYYNLILNRRVVSKVDWNSSEQMLRPDDLYKWGAIVEHNPIPRLSKGGSCIFLHIQAGPSSPTSGCTTFEENDLSRIIQWLRHDAHPVLVQLPRQEYLRLRAAWQLPSFSTHR